MTEPQPQLEVPSLRPAIICCGIAWASAVVGCVLGILTGQWLASVWALQVAIVAMGWLLATRQWHQWRALALAAVAIMDSALRPEDD